ncbi:CGNR zinc finger domain-containing protein [Mycetocola zhujimingii]|uniref:CGNR zinc finger domain-containing protein n=1 Tax=Mycetocola zhujimingii TaxID=2079792 RepID=UPI000D3981AB|nr:CGNR zinc finger domain-containing protein [Mycetocola zhujimingii]AWB85435.1 hypothetical protein C3E77_01485 [Mycetocola zhujimingii]
MASTERRTTFSTIAGHPALDLVNTVDWRLSRERFSEELVAYGDVLTWALQFELIDAAAARELERRANENPREAEAETLRVRELREAIYLAGFAEADNDTVAAHYRDAIQRGRLDLDGGKRVWKFPVDLSLPRHHMAIQALDLFTRVDAATFGQCHDAECGWVFLDTSPRHNRRWCVSADCGNRNRVREFYERNRKAGDSGPAA